MFRFHRLASSSSRRCLSSSLSSTKLSGLSGSRVTAVLGAQWGDEGKGKLVDVLGANYSMVARFNGGSNAGHTLVVNGVKYAFHLLPCGMLYPNVTNVIGNGVVLHVPTLYKEIAALESKGTKVTGQGTLKISNRAHLLFDFHQLVDGFREAGLGSEGKQIGTTKKGIGPAYASKSTRNGIRVGELFGDWALFESKYNDLLAYHKQQFGNFEYNAAEELARFKQYRESLAEYVVDTIHLVNDAYDEGKNILVEGANACLLDIDFGTYPYVTSSSTTAGGICTGLGLAPNKIENTFGVVKAYTTRVGSGPFPTEQINKIGDHLVEVGREFGTTTGRRRRCGWLDIPVIQYSHLINGYTSINITKLDVLTGIPEILIGVAYTIDGRRLNPGEMPSTLEELAKVKVEYEAVKGWTEDISKARKFEELPANAQAYILKIEELTKIPVSWIGVGAGRYDMATKGFTFSP